jgi:plastocyanin
MAAVTITFGNGNLTYSPPCLKVSAGAMVTWSGNFSSHPLAGGSNPPIVDATSPITETLTGMTATFTMSTPGAYGFFCEFHYAVGEMGAIFVQ